MTLFVTFGILNVIIKIPKLLLRKIKEGTGPMKEFLHHVHHLFHDHNNHFYLTGMLVLHSILLLLICFGIVILRRNIKNNYWRKRFCSYPQNAFDIFLVYNPRFKKYEYISPNFEKILGISQNEIKKNMYVLLNYVPENKRQENIEFFSKDNLKTFREMTFEFNHPSTKKRCWISLHVFPVFKNKKVHFYISRIRDSSSKYYYYSELQEALSKAQKANETQKELFSHISHEFKTMINAISGMTQIALHTLNNMEKVELCLNKINYASSQLTLLVNHILDTAKIDSEQLLLLKKPFYLKELLISIFEVFHSMADLKNQQFDIKIEKVTHNYINGDSLRLQEIIGNCLSNSIKFTPVEGKISLTVEELGMEDNRALYRFTIEDNGKGMKEDYIEHIFMPFEQEDSTISKQYGGSGLGMFITKKLVKLLNGSIHIKSKINVGTIIMIELEFEVMDEMKHPIPMLDQMNRSSHYNCSGIRVLVIEDNEISLEVTCEFLKFLNASFDVARNGDEALTMFQVSSSGYYNAILMDLHLPGISGLETSKLIRASSHPDASDIVIIAMTADNEIDRNALSEFGIDDVIDKPIEMNKFNTILYTINNRSKTYEEYQG